ncbi:MAG: glycosyltransferase family 2 protein [Lactobacillales bacterium]|jgi:rhamnosyltransferase|nr:glycosyltransferase family 2 protein [Lactobacillales bacterium]
MKLAILLSTYNGEQFLREQIDSILAQTLQNWTLYIRDDGSSDGTVAIIREYTKAHENIHFFNEQRQENVGVIRSFLGLLKGVEADYYCFCDQDDVWFPEKVQVTLEKMLTLPKEAPNLVYTDLEVVDEHLVRLFPSMIRKQSDHPNLDLLSEITENTVTGCTMMINEALKKKATSNATSIIMHDWWFALIAAAFGNLVYLDQPTVYYRQHSNNVLGARTLRKRLARFKRGKYVEDYWTLIHMTQQQARDLLTFFDGELTVEQKELLELFATLGKAPMRKRIEILKNTHLRKNKWFHTLIFRTLLSTNFGNKVN